MNGKPLVSIVIPVYKTELYLEECVRSAVEQSYKELELILVDDGSPDGSPALCDSLALNDDRITVIHKPNGGLSSARNAGIDRASGEFIFFLDSDDILEPGAIELAVSLVSDDVDAVISNKYFKFFDSGEPSSECEHIPEDEFCSSPKRFAVKVLMGRGRAWRAHSNLYRLDLIREHGVRFPEGHNAEDIVFNLRYYRHARRLAFITEPTLRYRKRSGSITSTFDPGFFRTIDFIDTEAKSFVEDCGVKGDEGYVDSLYLRNMIVFVTSMTAFRELRGQAKALLSSSRMKEAAKGYKSYPFFEGSKQRAYMGLMFRLQRLGLRGVSFTIAKAAARYMRQ